MHVYPSEPPLELRRLFTDSATITRYEERILRFGAVCKKSLGRIGGHGADRTNEMLFLDVRHTSRCGHDADFD
jgi:hypothetical protein